MKKEKQNMNFRNIEIRTSESEGKKYIEGIIPYDSKSVPMWGVNEIIAPTAFNKTLLDGGEIRALWNHNENFILGSTKSNTLILDNTDTGLICRCELPNTTYANDLFEVINRGDCKTMSFGFTPVKWEDSENGKTRTLKELKLHEVSYGVMYPAYPETTSTTFTRGIMKRNIDIEKLDEALDKEKLNDSDKLIIKNTVDILNNLVKDEAAEIEPDISTQKGAGTLPEKEDATILQLQIEAEIAA